MEKSGASVKSPFSSLQPKAKTFTDPSYYKKGAGLPKSRFSFLTFFLLLILVASVWIFLITIEILPNPYLQHEEIGIFAPKPKKKTASVQLKNEYKNPFDEKTQYVNPFSSYKNPFDTLK